MAWTHAAFCGCGPIEACALLFPAQYGRCPGGMMLLVLDVGNTNTVLGVYETGQGGAKNSSARLIAHWRVATVRSQTVDEYGVLFRNLFAIGKVEAGNVQSIIISS